MKAQMRSAFQFSVGALILGALAACGGGGGGTGGGSGGGTTRVAIGGTVSGLTGSGLVLKNNGGDSLSVGANGAFRFATSLSTGSAYSVSVASQPRTPMQLCAVTAGSGTAGSTDVSSISVTCAAPTPAHAPPERQ